MNDHGITKLQSYVVEKFGEDKKEESNSTQAGNTNSNNTTVNGTTENNTTVEGENKTNTEK